MASRHRRRLPEDTKCAMDINNENKSQLEGLEEQEQDHGQYPGLCHLCSIEDLFLSSVLLTFLHVVLWETIRISIFLLSLAHHCKYYKL